MVALLLLAFFQDAAKPCATKLQVAEVLRAQDERTLEKLHAAMPQSYVFQFSFAYRAFQLDPTLKTAGEYLAVLPKDEEQLKLRYEIDAGDCQLSDATYRLLDSSFEGTDKLAARAALYSSQYVDAYVRFGILTTEDVHTAYGRFSVPVCRKYPSAFRKAVGSLPSKDRQWYVTHIFNPTRCKSLIIEEE